MLQIQPKTCAALALGLFLCGHSGVSDCAFAENVGTRQYIAQPGDNFAILSRRTGFDGELIAAMNNLSAGYSCHGGEIISLPTKENMSRTAFASRKGSLRAGLASENDTWRAPLSGIITSAFAANRTNSPHHGIDIATASGTAILAAHGGTIIEAGWKNSVYGYAVLIDHGNGWQTRYAHCSMVLVKEGSSIKQGQKIALVGSTGNSTGPHLHLELIKDGVYLNPAQYFNDLSV